MPNFSQKERYERSAFLNRLYMQGYSTSAAMKEYDKEFGTHYSKSKIKVTKE